MSLRSILHTELIISHLLPGKSKMLNSDSFVNNLLAHWSRNLSVLSLEAILVIQDKPFSNCNEKCDFFVENNTSPLKRTYVQPCSGLSKFFPSLSLQFDVAIWSFAKSTLAFKAIFYHLFGKQSLFVLSQSRSMKTCVLINGQIYFKFLKPLSSIQDFFRKYSRILCGCNRQIKLYVFTTLK